MAVKAPSAEDLRRIGGELGFKLSAQDAESFRRLLSGWSGIRRAADAWRRNFGG